MRPCALTGPDSKARSATKPPRCRGGPRNGRESVDRSDLPQRNHSGWAVGRSSASHAVTARRRPRDSRPCGQAGIVSLSTCVRMHRRSSSPSSAATVSATDNRHTARRHSTRSSSTRGGCVDFRRTGRHAGCDRRLGASKDRGTAPGLGGAICPTPRRCAVRLRDSAVPLRGCRSSCRVLV